MLSRSYLFLLMTVSICSSVQAEESFEVGAGVVAQFLANYRGSEYYSAKALPIPYLLYSGKYFKVDRKGVRGELLSENWYELNVSVDASLSGDSKNNPVRIGMPKLDGSFEFGPSLNLNLSGDNFTEGWLLRLPVRGVMTYSKEGVDAIGYVINPRLTWRKPDVYDQWRMTFNLGAIWASEKYHEYYYEVQPQYALPWRQEYQAKAGYSGGFAKLGAYKLWGDWRLGVSLRVDYLGGAVFANSPLVETDSYASVGVAVLRRLHHW